MYFQVNSDVRAWARQEAVKRIERPTRPASARRLGYKAKQGFVMVRVAVKKGRRRRHSPTKGRKPHSMGVYFTPSQSKQAIAERRANRVFPNLEVLNSYKAGEDGKRNYYEIILVDTNHPSTKLHLQRKRAFRGLTSAGRKSRGLVR